MHALQNEEKKRTRNIANNAQMVEACKHTKQYLQNHAYYI